MQVVRARLAVRPLGMGVQMERVGIRLDLAVRVHSDAEHLENKREKLPQAVVALVCREQEGSRGSKLRAVMFKLIVDA